MNDCNILNLTSEYEEYLHDESREIGSADSISFPLSEVQLQNVIKRVYDKGDSITVQGSRTGITGGAVPLEHHVINLSKMDRILGLKRDEKSGIFLLKVQPGAILSSVNNALLKKDIDVSDWSKEQQKAFEDFCKEERMFFSPDPTEKTASIGGMVSCNASGARSFCYGPTRGHIHSIKVILSDSSVLHLERGVHKADGLKFSIETGLGRTIEGSLPLYKMPQVKNASGYFTGKDIDLVDLFIGSEGTLGIICEIEIELIKFPPSIWGILAFFSCDEQAVEFSEVLKREMKPNNGLYDSKLVAIEYFNSHSINLLRIQKRNPAFSKIPAIPDNLNTAVYFEFHGSNDDYVCDRVMEASRIIKECGGNDSSAWVASNERELDRLYFLRHAVPEAINLFIDSKRKNDPKISKLSTDMAVPDGKLKEVLNYYNETLEENKLNSVMFGHIGDNHVHVNILPGSVKDYETGKALYNEWGKKIVELGGTVSAEHGIGKIKKELLKIMYGESGIKEMKLIKKAFDPKGLLNKGNLFD